MSDSQIPNSGRKLFFGLFIFPLLIAVGMAVLLCSVVLLTNEKETPQTLIAAIKSGSPGKRWQKAFELSNDLNLQKNNIRNDAMMGEIIHILNDPERYDSKTRGYMAIALGHFDQPESIEALRRSLSTSSEDVQIYALWSLGTLQAKGAAADVLPFLKNDKDDLRKMAAYVLGVMGGPEALTALKPLLNDKTADVRWNAALSLARLGDDSGNSVLLSMLDRNALSSELALNDEQIEPIMINAIKGLALIGNKEPIKILQSVSRTDKSLKVRQAAIEAMEYQKQQKGVLL